MGKKNEKTGGGLTEREKLGNKKSKNRGRRVVCDDAVPPLPLFIYTSTELRTTTTTTTGRKKKIILRTRYIEIFYNKCIIFIYIYMKKK